MKQRILTAETPQHIDQEVLVQGWVHARRDHGKLLFIDLRDRSGLLQIVFNPRVSEEAHKIAQTLRPEFVVSIKGKINARPERLVNAKIASGTVELEATQLEILAEAETLPFDMGGEELHLELPTLLDYRSLTLRHDKVRKIFLVQAAVAEGFRNAAKELDCTEIFVPTIAAGATEGGADVFKVDYYGHPAFMIQSPQLYKQMMVGVFERVSVITKAYRAEPSVTSRHLAEVTMIDIEMAFINSFEELLDAVELVGTSIMKHVSEKHADILADFGIQKPLIPTQVPRLTLREAQAIITKRTGRDLSKEQDLNPEDEKEICLWAKEEHKSDFVTITHYPTKKRAFYTYPDPKDPEYSLSYDLLFKGTEILSGSRRINDYQQLLTAMDERGIDPDNFGMYLQAFKYGMPPEGGFSFGLERITMKLLELSNVREASLFPRDMERVDERFSVIAAKSKTTKEENKKV
ncbi:MAG: aspartate--tRNA(Asn) ligase [Patescibacteria group bacterium]